MAGLTMDLETLRGWIGRREEAIDAIPVSAVRLVQAFYGLDPVAVEGDPLAETWHWCFFHRPVPHTGLGEDGHHAVGGFLPPFDLPRRMWGGSRISFERPVRIGRETRKVSTIASVDIKQGASGTLGIVRVEQVITQDGATCLVELQDLIYREAEGTGAPPSSQRGAPAGAEAMPQTKASETVVADEVMLFRYSALTYNAHRIHYDRDYAVKKEGYPDLVVHGPLTASRLARFAVSRVEGRRLREFSFRGTLPLFCGETFALHAREADGDLDLWAANQRGEIAMKARASF